MLQGAAPLLQNKGYLSAAAGLLGIEAYHAGALRAFLLPYAGKMTPYNVNVSTVVQAISSLRDAADGPGHADKGLFDGPMYPNNAVLAPGDADHLAFGRTVNQVLSIVSLGAKANKGGFFPMGLNGCFQ